MVIASEPGWLHTAGQAAGTILLLELLVVLFVVLALTCGLAFGMWWVRRKVVPVLQEYAPRAGQVMVVAQQGSEKVVTGVAEFYGRRQQVQTSLRVLLFGRGAAERVREDALAQAAEDLQLMSPPEAGPGPANGWTPQLRNRIEGRTAVAGDGRTTPPPGRLPERERGAAETGQGGATGTGEDTRGNTGYNREEGHRGANGTGDDRDNFGNMAGNAG